MSSFERFQELPCHHYENRINIQEFLTQAFQANTPYIVSWYGRLNTNYSSGIRAEVYFVNQESGFYTRAEIPIELIPKMPIGSVWINGACNSKLLASNDTLVMLRDVGYEGSVDTNIEYKNLHNEDFPESLKNQYHISVVVKVLDEFKFLSDWSGDYTLKKLVNMLKDNNGRLKQSVYDEFGVNGPRNGDIIIAKYKHINEETSNWILNGLGKFGG